MNDQLEQYEIRRTANTLLDGTRPYAWWKRYQRQISQSKAMSDAEILRDAARLAKAQAELLGDGNE